MTLPYTVTQLKKDIQNRQKFTYVFFWGGPFSQWKMADFEIDGIIYNCAEQMEEKARLFGDNETLQRILLSPYPKSQKELGRKVRNYDDAEWNKVRKQIVIKGNIAKFSQNKNLHTF